MKELNDERVLADFMIRTSGDAAAAETDLSQLADQLLSIAEKLRKSDPAASGKTAETSNGSNVSSFRRTAPASIAALRVSSAVQAQTDQKSGSNDVEVRRAEYAKTARWIYATRRRRTTIFENSELFGEPAWDILLDLYIAHTEGKPVSVSSACIGSAAPPTTGLRWLGLLADNGLVLREHDPEDQRRVLVRLTEGGLTAMDNYFATGGFPM